MIKTFVAFLICLTLTPIQLLASGFSKPVWGGARAIGLGGAFVSVADDATALWHNPGAIGFFDHQHYFYLGSDAIITDLDYTPLGFPTETAETEFLPVPSFAYINNSFDLLRLGIGVYFPHGNGGTFATPSVLPINALEGQIYSMELLPTIAWQMTDWISLGVSLRLVRISNQLKGFFFADPATGMLVDTVNNLDVSGWTVGGALGIMAKPYDWLNVGLLYRTQVKKKLEGDVDFATLGTTDATLEMTLPTLINIGLSAQANDWLMLSFAYGFEKNTEVNSFDVGTSITPTTTLPQNWNNSHTVHFGAELKPTQDLQVLLGYGLDLMESIPDAVVTRITGDVQAHEVSAGLGWDISEKFNTTLAWNARFGSRTIPQQGPIPPAKIEAFVNTISLGLGVKL